MLYLNGGAIYVGSDNATVHDTGVAQIETTFSLLQNGKRVGTTALLMIYFRRTTLNYNCCAGYF